MQLKKFALKGHFQKSRRERSILHSLINYLILEKIFLKSRINISNSTSVHMRFDTVDLMKITTLLQFISRSLKNSKTRPLVVFSNLHNSNRNPDNVNRTFRMIMLKNISQSRLKTLLLGKLLTKSLFLSWF